MELRRGYVGQRTTVGTVAGGAVQGLRRTTDNGGRWPVEIRRGYVGQRTTEGGGQWRFAGIMELRIGRVGWGLKAQSLSIPFYTLYTHNSLLTVVMR